VLVFVLESPLFRGPQSGIGQKDLKPVLANKINGFCAILSDGMQPEKMAKNGNLNLARLPIPPRGQPCSQNCRQLRRATYRKLMVERKRPLRGVKQIFII
jgi:hypothetical protein